MEALLTVDASKQYNAGQAFLIVPDGTFGLYQVKFKNNGNVPDVLAGSYTHATLAAKACESYLALRDSIFEVKERRDSVKKGKEEHAAKKVAQVEEV